MHEQGNQGADDGNNGQNEHKAGLSGVLCGTQAEDAGDDREQAGERHDETCGNQCALADPFGSEFAHGICRAVEAECEDTEEHAGNAVEDARDADDADDPLFHLLHITIGTVPCQCGPDPGVFILTDVFSTEAVYVPMAGLLKYPADFVKIRKPGIKIK